jgi:hypothetical protein
MAIFLIILGSLVFVIAAILLYGRYSMMPKFFYKPKPLLKRLFFELNDHLPAAAKGLIPKQLEYFKWGSPLPFPKYLSIDIHFDKKNPQWEKNAFERKDGFKLATIWFEYDTKEYTANFKCYDGHIGGMTISPRTRGILKKKNITITKFKLHNDPMEKLDLEVVDEFYAAGESLPALLLELKDKYTIQEVKKSLPAEKRMLFLRISEVKFPGDYLALVEQTNGFTINDVIVNGLGQYDDVPMNDGNYLMLADGPGAILALKQSKRNTRLKYISVEDETDIRDLGDQFMPALEEFMNIVKDNN